MKTRRHHNNKGYRQIKSGSSHERLKRFAEKLGIPFEPRPHVTDGGDCWCNPTIKRVRGAEIVIHNYPKLT